MIAFTGIHSPPFDIPFFPPRGRGGGHPLLVSSVEVNVGVVFWRPQLCFHRKRLILCRANQQLLDSVLDGSLHGDRGGTPMHVIENFLHLPDTSEPVPSTPKNERSDSKSLRAVLQVSVPGPSGTLPPHVLYLLELGFDLEQIKVIAGKYPPFANYSLEGNVRPLIKFMLDLGVSRSDLPKVLNRRPQLCGISQKKFEATVEFLYEMGVSKDRIMKILTRFPQIISSSVEEKLRPTAEYFKSLGADVSVVLRDSPEVMNLSLEANLKPFTEFFLEKGFSEEEIGAMVSKFGSLYKYSLKLNVAPKWEFFLTTEYQRQHLIQFPQYFSYSLEERIKPRYKVMKESGVKMSLSQLLSRDHSTFELSIRKKVEKLQSPCN